MKNEKLTLRQQHINPRALNTNPKALGTNPRALGTNPLASIRNLYAFRQWKKSRKKKRLQELKQLCELYPDL